MMDPETAAEFARIREMLTSLASRTDLTADQAAHANAANAELRAIVIGPGAHALTDRVPKLEARADGFETRLTTSDARNAMQHDGNRDDGGFWSSVIAAGSKAAKVYGALPVVAQVMLWLAALAFVLLLSDGGRELLRLLLTGSADTPTAP